MQHTHFSRFTRKELQQGSQHQQSSVRAAARRWSALGRAAGPGSAELAQALARSVLSPVPRFLRLTARRLSSAREAGSDHRLLRSKLPPHAFARRHLFTQRAATCTCKAGACLHRLLGRPAYLPVAEVAVHLEANLPSRGSRFFMNNHRNLKA